MPDLFATEEEERSAGVGTAGDDLFASPDEESAAGIEVIAPRTESPSPAPDPGFRPDEGRKGGDTQGGALQGLSDAWAGLGNTLNLNRGTLRALKSAGLIDARLADDALAELDADESTRRGRGMSFGTGEMVGSLGAGVAGLGVGAPAGAAGAALTGAGMGAVSEAGRTGDLESTAKGAAAGALTGLGGHAAGQALGRAAGWAASRTRAGEQAAKVTEGVAAAGRRAQRFAGTQGQQLPAARVAGETLEEGLDSVPEALAHLVMRGRGAVEKAAREGRLGPQAMADALELTQRQIGETTGQRAFSAMTDVPLELASRLAPAASRVAGPVSRAAAPMAGELLSESGVAQAQYEAPSYSAALEGAVRPSPLEDDRDEHFDAFREAYQSPVMQAYPGLASELSGLLSSWTMGEEPSKSQVALMAYKLSDVPGLQWAMLDPTRAGDDDDE